MNDPNIVRMNPKPRLAGPSMFDIPGCVKTAKRVYDEIVSVLEEIDSSPLIGRAEFSHISEVVQLPLRRVTHGEYMNALKIIDDFSKSASKIDYRYNASLYIYAGTTIRYRHQQNHEFYNTEMHFIRLGNAAFVSCPFELFLDYGNKIGPAARRR